jgi:hypothetical protein
MLVLGPFMVLGAVLARDSLGGAGPWALILAAAGLGELAGGLVALRLRPRWPLRAATWAGLLWTPQVALLALEAPVWVISVAALVAGAGMSFVVVIWNTALQEHVPARTLARVSSYDWAGTLVFLPLGFVLAGPAAAALSTPTVLWLVVGASSTRSFAVPSVRADGPGGRQPRAGVAEHEPALGAVVANRIATTSLEPDDDAVPSVVCRTSSPTASSDRDGAHRRPRRPGGPGCAPPLALPAREEPRRQAVARAKTRLCARAEPLAGPGHAHVAQPALLVLGVLFQRPLVRKRPCRPHEDGWNPSPLALWIVMSVTSARSKSSVPVREERSLRNASSDASS